MTIHYAVAQRWQWLLMHIEWKLGVRNCTGSISCYCHQYWSDCDYLFFWLISNSHAYAGHLGNPSFYKEKCTSWGAATQTLKVFLMVLTPSCLGGSRREQKLFTGIHFTCFLDLHQTHNYCTRPWLLLLWQLCSVPMFSSELSEPPNLPSWLWALSHCRGHSSVGCHSQGTGQGRNTPQPWSVLVLFTGEGVHGRFRTLFSRGVELGLGPHIISKLQKTFLELSQYSVHFLEGIFYTDFGTSSKLFMCANHFCRHLQS